MQNEGAGKGERMQNAKVKIQKWSAAGDHKQEA
jgi:hypothetical protein